MCRAAVRVTITISGRWSRPEPRTRDLGTGWVHRGALQAIYTSRFEELCDNQGTKIYLLVQENRLGGDAHAYSEGIMSQFDDILKFLGFLNKTSHFLDFGLIKKIIAYIYILVTEFRRLRPRYNLWKPRCKKVYVY